MTIKQFLSLRKSFLKQTPPSSSQPGWVWVQIFQLIHLTPVMANVTSILFMRQWSENCNYDFPPGFSILTTWAYRSWVDFQIKYERKKKKKRKPENYPRQERVVPGFWWLIFKSYLILFKIRWKIHLKINCSLKTPLNRPKGVTLSWLWAPA